MTAAYHVHPLAGLFPTLGDEALKDLAADIEVNGLRHPVSFVRRDGMNLVIDGLNRMRACLEAKVEADFVELDLDDDEVRAFITSENLQRRHMSKGQRAMAAVAMAGDYGTWTGHGSSGLVAPKRGENNSHLSRIVGVDRMLVSRARQVIEADLGLASKVLAGEVALAKAHETIKPKPPPKPKPKPKTSRPGTVTGARETNEETHTKYLEVPVTTSPMVDVPLPGGSRNGSRPERYSMVSATVVTPEPMAEDFIVKSIRQAKPRASELVKVLGTVEPYLTRWVEDLRLGFVQIEDAEAVFEKFDRMAGPLLRHLTEVDGDWRNPKGGAR